MIPAGTNASGREEIPVFGETFNTNMQNLQSHGWPQERNQVDGIYPWLHSDINDVAYPYVQDVFNLMVNEGGL